MTTHTKETRVCFVGLIIDLKSKSLQLVSKQDLFSVWYDSRMNQAKAGGHETLKIDEDGG